MRLACNQKDLLLGLSVVGRAVSARTTLPILGNILLHAQEDGLMVAATNLESIICCWIDANVKESGSTTVPAKLLSDFISSLSGETVRMKLSKPTETLRLKCDNSTASIKGITSEDFPSVIAEDTNAQTIPVTNTDLAKMIDQSVFAAAKDEARPTLTGVHVTMNSQRMSIAATDGYRLSVRSVEMEDGADLPEKDAIVKAVHLADLGRMLANTDAAEHARLSFAENGSRLTFFINGKEDVKGSFKRATLTSQLIADDFPDYQAIIPKNFTTTTTVQRNALLQAAKIASLFVRDTANIIQLQINPPEQTESEGEERKVGTLTVIGSGAESGDNETKLDAAVNGIPISISFNGIYLIDVLSRISESHITIETSDPNRPGTLRPAHVDKKDFLHVIMPMFPPK